MTYTSPERLPITLLIVPFAYIFSLVFFTVVYVFYLIDRPKVARLLGFISGIFVVLLFILGSLHQLDVKDVLLSLLITVVLSWYVIKIRQTSS